MYDNPLGVMTNGPTFPWHLTNLGNWTHLTNVDQSSAASGPFDVKQPDSGIATAALPGSSTSVGRFIRAVFYSNFTEKVADPDKAMH
ncbi:MAG: linear amide C-N hydrolase, partial [Candidatus Microthrix parvicella]